jgi:hypothetical protein
MASSPSAGKRPRSERQIAASRANGAKSKGPTSAEGKRNSSRNSTRHGLFAKTVTISREEDEFLTELLKNLALEWRPTTHHEVHQLQRLAVTIVRSKRIAAIEAAVISKEIRNKPEWSKLTPDTRIALAFESLADNSNVLQAIDRYESANDRRLHQTLKALDQIRKRKHKAP